MYDLNDDGTITFDFGDGLVRTLRRPKLKQYRALLESLNSMRRDLVSDVPDVDENSTPEEIAAAEAAMKDVDVDAQFDKLVGWLREVFSVIGDGPLPDEDQLDAWIVNGTVTADLVKHWTKVPTRRGGQ